MSLADNSSCDDDDDDDELETSLSCSLHHEQRAVALSDDDQQRCRPLTGAVQLQRRLQAPPLITHRYKPRCIIALLCFLISLAPISLGREIRAPKYAVEGRSTNVDVPAQSLACYMHRSACGRIIL